MNTSTPNREQRAHDAGSLPATNIPDAVASRNARPKLTAAYLVAPRKPRILLPIVLFLVTFGSTFFVGSMSWEPQQALDWIIRHPDGGIMVRQFVLRHAMDGLIYATCVIAILFAHEMGHFVATRIYSVPSSLPFFIPFPIAPIGTMGAVIAMKGQKADRREIFDIGLAGPIAGLVFAIPIVWWGVASMESSAAASGSFRYDMPLLVRWLHAWIHPNQPAIRELYASQMNPMFMAGWVGLLITGLNMLPVSQLDGGHVTYTLFGRHSRWIARVFVCVAIAYMAFAGVHIWFVMLALIFLIGIDHPKTANDDVPLGLFRVFLGLVSLAIPVLCFPPRGLF